MSDCKLDNGGTLKECIYEFLNKNKYKILKEAPVLEHRKSLALGKYEDVTFYARGYNTPLWTSHFKTTDIENKIWSMKKRIGNIAKVWLSFNSL